MQTLLATHTHTLTSFFSVSLSLTYTQTHTVWLNNGPVSGVPMGKAVSLIESSILHSPSLLIDSVRLFCLTKRLTFPPVWLYMTVTVRGSACMCVFVCAEYLLRATETCLCVCVRMCVPRCVLNAQYVFSIKTMKTKDMLC